MRNHGIFFIILLINTNNKTQGFFLMDDNLQSITDYKLLQLKQNRERTFANWRKNFIYNHTEVDVNSSYDHQKESIAENIGLEELRGIFTSGYIFAMLQTKQTFDEMNAYLDRKDYLKKENGDIAGQDTERYKYFLEVQNEMFKFINEKIEDSYCLNTEKNLSISKKLLKYLQDHFVSYERKIRHNLLK